VELMVLTSREANIQRGRHRVYKGNMGTSTFRHQLQLEKNQDVLLFVLCSFFIWHMYHCWLHRLYSSILYNWYDLTSYFCRKYNVSFYSSLRSATIYTLFHWNIEPEKLTFCFRNLYYSLNMYFDDCRAQFRSSMN
jgi:hypothetical protein